MKKQLEIGSLMSGAKFSLPLDFVVHTDAIISIRGWGKTVLATVLAEEMCEAGLPWIALDPVHVWWGLRANPDGTPGGYPLVIVGGEHGDIPLEKDMGAKLADTILSENFPCIIDLHQESKNTWRKFVADFCDRLMELRPAVPRHIFIEEAPEFVPQRPMGEQKRSLAAVDRLIRLGRNNGYGATLISQRYATIQKDVLTQCESLFAGRMIGKPDRKACAEWIAEVVATQETQKQADRFLDSLASLDNGTGWFWSPQVFDLFQQVRIRPRKTFHPGETRSVGVVQKQVTLSNVSEFVERFRKALDKKPHKTPKAFAEPAPRMDDEDLRSEIFDSTQQEAGRLRAENAELHRKVGVFNSIIASLRQNFGPQYETLKKVFTDLDQLAASNGTGSGIDAGVFEQWKAKLGAGPAKCIDILIQRGGRCTRRQMQTLAGYSDRSMTNNISALNSNGLIRKEGNEIVLQVP